MPQAKRCLWGIPWETMWLDQRVGDSLGDDVAGPKSVGMSACWVNRANQALPPGGEAPDFMVADLTGLEEILVQGGGRYGS